MMRDIRSRSISALLCLILLCGACFKTADQPYLDVTDAAAVPLRTLDLGPQGAYCTLRVQASAGWRLDAPAWIGAEPTSGKGIMDVALSVQANTGTEARDGTLVFRQGDEVVCVTVRQQGSSVVSPYLTILDTGGNPIQKMNVPFGGLHAYIRVETGDAWQLSASEDWLNASTGGAEGTTEVYVSAQTNPSGEQRHGSFTFTTQSQTAVLEIVQEAEPLIEPVAAPAADLLDVVFAADGSAMDCSAAHLDVVKVASEKLSVRFNDAYQRYAAVFDSDPGNSITEGFYYADYENNAAVTAGLDNSHSLEILLFCKQLPSPSHQVKPFSTMSSGGTGFVYSKSDHLTVQRRFAFAPYIGEGYCYTVADGVGIGAWHHVVGVWDADAGATYVYVDGNLTDTVVQEGAYVQAEETARHFVIGGDAYKGLTKAEACFRGEIALVRAYSTALSAGQALWLYRSVCQ